MSSSLTVAQGRVGGAADQHQVGRLQVAVNQSLRVDVLQALQRLEHQPHRLGRRQLLAPQQHVFQRFALQILHDQIVEAAGLADLEGADDVGVLEPHGQLGLALEAAEEVRFAGPRRRQHLDGEDLAEPVLRLVDAGHAALAQPVEDLVIVEEEAVGVAAHQQRRLILGRVLVRRQPRGEARQAAGRVLGLGLPARIHRLGFIDGQQLAAQQQAVDVLHREFHGPLG